MRHTSLLLLGCVLAITGCGGGSSDAETEATVEARVSEERVIEATTEAKIQAMAIPMVEVTAQAAPAATSTATPTPMLTPTAKLVPPTATTAPLTTATFTPVMPTSTATPTAIPTLVPKETILSVGRQLKWPIDVGTSHFGALGNELEGFSGAWIRPLPGRFVWGVIEPQRGKYHWEGSDNWVRRWQSSRLATLVMIWPFAEWDQNSCHADKPKALSPPNFSQYEPSIFQRLYAPCDSEAYASWLGAAVERYDGDGLNDMPGLEYPIRYWEVGNEPDMQGPNHTLFQGDPEAYLELLKLSYNTIKAADHNATVLLAAPSKWTPEVVGYWRPVLQGGTGYFDVGNMHSLKGDDDFRATEYRELLDEYGARDKPFWVTEAGVFVGGKALDQEELSKITIPNYASAFAAGAQVIFRLYRGHASGQVLETYLLAAQTFGDFATATGLAENVVKFDMPDGRTVFALWDHGTLPKEVTGKVKVVTYNGKESSQDASDVVAQVPTLIVIETGDGRTKTDQPLQTTTNTPVSGTRFKPSLEPVVQNIPIERAVSYGSGATADGSPVDLLLDLFLPDTGGLGPRPLAVYIHHGAFVGGSRGGPGFYKQAAQRGWVVASIDYRLRGDNALPGPRMQKMLDALGGSSSSALYRSVVAAVEDTLTALDYLLDRAEELYIDPDRIVLIGASAGATTALNVAYAADNFGIDRPDIAAVVDLWGTIPESFGEESTMDPGEPPLFIIHGTEDTVVEFTRALNLVRGAESAGILYEFHPQEGAGHGFGGIDPGSDTAADGRSLESAVFEFLDRVLYQSEMGVP